MGFDKEKVEAKTEKLASRLVVAAQREIQRIGGAIQENENARRQAEETYKGLIEKYIATAQVLQKELHSAEEELILAQEYAKEIKLINSKQ